MGFSLSDFYSTMLTVRRPCPRHTGVITPAAGGDIPPRAPGKNTGFETLV